LLLFVSFSFHSQSVPSTLHIPIWLSLKCASVLTWQE
jgi:hypothetical protein